MLHEWLEAVRSRSVGRVLNLYTDEAVLVPTLGPTVLQGKAQLAPYFHRFLAKQNLRGRLDCVVTQRLGPKDQILSGLYTFAWTERGKPHHLRARFTYVIVETPKGWRILTHHSSAVPS